MGGFRTTSGRIQYSVGPVRVLAGECGVSGWLGSQDAALSGPCLLGPSHLGSLSGTIRLWFGPFLLFVGIPDAQREPNRNPDPATRARGIGVVVSLHPYVQSREPNDLPSV